MSNKPFLSVAQLPYCKGCGHALVAQNTEKALNKLSMEPLDVILVTDIGCHGIIDKSFLSHTVHGLHGRSVALASGIAAAKENPTKKIVVFIGDGGATIGMQHLVGSAHMGFDITVVVHNNMLYGMTGGQPSGFTPCGFKTPTLPEGNTRQGYDICEIITAAKASYVERVVGIGDFSDSLARAISTKGFSLVEVLEICPSYGVKSNPGMKLSKIVEDSGLQVKIFVEERESQWRKAAGTPLPNLISNRYEIETQFEHNMDKPISIMMAGSAGEGVQSAAELLARTAISTGLNATKKGSYPVTVGVGFSASEVILSPSPIDYTGSPIPDVLIITSTDGLNYAKAAAGRMKTGLVLVDESIESPATGAQILRIPFRDRVGARNSSLYSIFWLINHRAIFPIEALKEIFMKSKVSEKIKIETMLQF